MSDDMSDDRNRWRSIGASGHGDLSSPDADTTRFN